MIFIGIDPGLTGACAFIDHNGVRAVFDLPTMEIPGVGPKALVKRKLDGKAFGALLLKNCPVGEGRPTAMLEAVGTMGGANNAVQTQGSLLRTLGAIETALECLNFPVQYVQPQKWKKAYGIGSDKAKSLAAARQLYPGAAAELKRVRDHNRAESILLAHWGMRELS